MSKVNMLKCSNEEANRLTKKYICEALITLMQEKKFDEIKITDVVKKAAISRVGFYNNYKSKYDVLKDIVLETNRKVIRKIGRPFVSDITKDWYYNFFEIIEEQSSVMILLNKAGFKTYYLDVINEYILSKEDITSDDIKIKRLLWNGGIQNIAWHWVINGMKESKAYMAEICFELFHNHISYR